MTTERRVHILKVKAIVDKCDRMNECVALLLKEGLVTSNSEGRRLYTQLKLTPIE